MSRDTGNEWKERHTRAFENPRPGHERALVNMIKGLREYALAHKKEFDSDLADDGFLGDEWKDAAKGVRALLNGKLGRLDGGTLDSIIHDTANDAGFDPNTW